MQQQAKMAVHRKRESLLGVLKIVKLQNLVALNP
jgi:hypothetical protein